MRINPIHPTGPRNEEKFAIASVPAPTGIRNPTIEQSIPDVRRRVIIVESHDLQIIQFSQRHVRCQFLRRVLLRPRRFAGSSSKGCANPTSAPARGPYRSHPRPSATNSSPPSRVSRIPRQQNPVANIQQSQMTPLCRVKFLPVHNHRVRVRSRIDLPPRIRNIRNPLLLIHNQIVHNPQILRLRLQNQMLRRIPILSSIIHVHMQITADPVIFFSGFARSTSIFTVTWAVPSALTSTSRLSSANSNPFITSR